MFTGLIAALGRVVSASSQGRGLALSIDLAELPGESAPGASIAIDGVCLTVTKREGSVASFDATSETASRSTLGRLKAGDRVHLEPALRIGDRLDGHLVQGHVDAVGLLLEVKRLPESRLLRFSLPEAIAPLVAAKGSIAVQGVSLTVVEAWRDAFSVSLIPETLRRTTFESMAAGARVNLEADVVARYLARLQFFGPSAAPPAAPPPERLSEETLRSAGFFSSL